MRTRRRTANAAIWSWMLLLAPPQAFGAHFGNDEISIALNSSKTDDIGAVFEGEPRFEQNSHASYAPASVTKIFIAGLSLETLGPEFRFQTRLKFERIGGTEARDLVLVATGDPTVGVAAFENQMGASVFEQFALKLKNEGIRTFSGPIRVMAESDRWDRREIAPLHWKSSHLKYCYGAIVSAAMYSGNCVGDRPIIDGSRQWIAQMNLALKKAGIAYKPKKPKLFHNSRQESYVALSLPLRDLLKPFMKNSINIFGESLLIQVGAQARLNSTAFRESALEALRNFLHDLVPEYPDEIALDDGCGLSTVNRATPRATAAFLDHVRKKTWFNDFFDGLAVSGSDGTLEGRLQSASTAGRIFAKTGTLAGVASLAGYVTEKGHPEKIMESFALLGLGNVTRLRQQIDRAVEIRAESGGL